MSAEFPTSQMKISMNKRTADSTSFKMLKIPWRELFSSIKDSNVMHCIVPKLMNKINKPN
jgi:hypothetical protein